MSGWNRRDVFCGAAALSTSPLLSTAESRDPRGGALPTGPKPLIHTTDLFRPYNDPDDHWDLATGYALAWVGDLDLVGVLTDNPKNIEQLPELQRYLDKVDDNNVFVARSPDVAAVAQLNYITNRAVPVTTGTIWLVKPGEKVHVDNLPRDLSGVNMLLDILKRSPQPVAILTGGSCQDVAIAGTRAPSLFAEKCAGVYMNAGAGSQTPKEQSIILEGGEWPGEWNVSLNRGAYAAMFELPCPIY
jgi:inosine-uridine nucleoside N-ribohydrolase